MRSLVPQYGKSRVLVLGYKDVVSVAKSYGFERVVTVPELHARHPSAYPFYEPEDLGSVTDTEASGDNNGNDNDNADEVVGAVLVMHDPVDWARELQLTCDVLHSGGVSGVDTHAQQQVPLFISNPDFVFSATHPEPRFAQGAFNSCLAHLYEKTYGVPLKVTECGKPHRVTYALAEEILLDQWLRAGEEDIPAPSSTLSPSAPASSTSASSSSPASSSSSSSSSSSLPEDFRFYGIGDNPRADIRGANDAGDAWTSVLVRTGVFDHAGEGQANDVTDPADIVCDDVEKAVEQILRREDVV